MESYQMIVQEYTVIKPILYFSIECICYLLNTFDNNKQIAAQLQNKLKNKFGGEWSCILGTNFVAELSISTDYYMKIAIKDFQILIFKN